MTKAPLLTWKGRRVRSVNDRPETVVSKVSMVSVRPGSLFFIPSPLEGWGIDTLLKRLPADTAVVLLEIDPELKEYCDGAWREFLGPRISDPRLFWLESDTEAAVQQLFRQLPLARLRRCEFLTLNGAWMSQGSRYREVFQRLEDGLVRWWSNRMTCLHLGPLWIRNLLDNLATPGLAWQPWPQWGTDTVLVCGAGVSLEDALPWAKENRHRIRIVAADTALPVLRSYGLVPDAVVCLEAQHANLRDFAGWLGADVSLFTDLTSFPPGTRVFHRPPYWFITEFAELNLWARWPWDATLVPRLPPLGSVGVAAAWVSWKLSRGPVLLAGLDFSFPTGKSHARGAPALTALQARTTRFLPMEQVGVWKKQGCYQVTGKPWLTTPVMEGYAGVLSDQARVESQRTWVWDSRGLPLGLPTWDGTRPLPTLGTETGAQENPFSIPPEEWLQEECQRWEQLLETFVRLNQTPLDEQVWTSLEQELKAVDYLTFAFPDPDFCRHSDWLIRAQVRVRWAVSRLRRS